MTTTEKVSIGYQLHGEGKKKIIALHSWMDDAESWNTTIPFLNTNEFSYAFMDVRGYGTSRGLKGMYNSDEIAADVFQLADDLGWREFYLIGHSMCGLAAQKAALLDTGMRIRKIVLITPVSAGGFPADEDTLSFFTSIVQNEEVAKVAYGAFTENRLSAHWQGIRAKRHVEVTASEAQLEYIRMWTGENFIDQMKQVDTPFLVLPGKHDHPQFKLDAQQKAFAGFKQVDFIEIGNAGHFPMQEAPVFLISTIEFFFSK